MIINFSVFVDLKVFEHIKSIPQLDISDWLDFRLFWRQIHHNLITFQLKN